MLLSEPSTLSLNFHPPINDLLKGAKLTFCNALICTNIIIFFQISIRITIFAMCENNFNLNKRVL